MVPPKTKNSSDLAHYFFVRDPNSLTKITKIKKKISDLVASGVLVRPAEP